jgi:2-C-methyl-D-erythritol 4-phosphate cytidylyltransferase
MKAAAIVVAAGEGARLGRAEPKAWIQLCGRPILLRAIDNIGACGKIAQIIVVVAEAELARCEALLRNELPATRSWAVQIGGATRQQSVRRGLEKIGRDVDLVLIHDAARPFASPNLIERVLSAACEHGAAVAGLPARDTIKRISPEHRIETTLDRSALWEIQTPQAFHRDLIVPAHERAAAENAAATDDAMLLERLGVPVYVVEGERMNFKITVAEDLLIAEALVRAGRIG